MTAASLGKLSVHPSILERIAMPSETSCYKVSSERIVQFLSMLLGCFLAVDLAVAEDAFSPLELGHVKVGGEIGRRIDLTVENNLLVWNAPCST